MRKRLRAYRDGEPFGNGKVPEEFRDKILARHPGINPLLALNIAIRFAWRATTALEDVPELIWERVAFASRYGNADPWRTYEEVPGSALGDFNRAVAKLLTEENKKNSK